MQPLPFEDASFDSVVGTCVFCSVPDPFLGLRELRRVLVPEGQLFLLEHVLSPRPVVRQLMRLMNPMVVRMMGANIDRDTVENVRSAGYEDLQVDDLWLEIFKRIQAHAPAATTVAREVFVPATLGNASVERKITRDNSTLPCR